MEALSASNQRLEQNIERLDQNLERLEQSIEELKAANRRQERINDFLLRRETGGEL